MLKLEAILSSVFENFDAQPDIAMHRCMRASIPVLYGYMYYCA